MNRSDQNFYKYRHFGEDLHCAIENSDKVLCIVLYFLRTILKRPCEIIQAKRYCRSDGKHATYCQCSPGSQRIV